MGCLWERRYGTDRTSPPRQKRIPIPTGQITVRQNRKGRRPIRLQSPWEPSPKPDKKTGKERKKQSERQQKHPKTGHRKPHPRQIRSPKPEYLYKTHPILHICRISYTQSQPNGKSIGSERFYGRRTKWRRLARNGKRHG